MTNQQDVSERLYQIHFQRNKHVWIFHIFLLSLSTYFERAKIFYGNFWWMAFVCVAAGSVMRILFVRVFYDQWVAGSKKISVLNYAGMFTLALGWSFHFYAVFKAFGSNSYNTSQTLLNIAVLIIGATLSSAAHKKSFYALATPILLSIFLMFLFDSESKDEAIMTYLSTFYFFSIYFMTIGNKELIRSIDNELNAKREKDRISRIIDTVPGFVSVYDENLICVLANKVMLSLYPTIVGHKIGGLETGSDWETYVTKFHESGRAMCVDEGASFIEGRNRWSLRNCRRNVDNGVVFVAMEITELVEARIQLRNQEAKSHFSAKLASLGEMAAGIAHEINNPLAIIQGSASIIQKLVDLEPMDKDTIKLLSGKMIETTNRIAKTIRSLKALSRSGDNDPFENVDLRKMIDQCLDVSRQRCERAGIKLIIPQFEKLITFRAREVQISQVLMNLISNAIDAVKGIPDPWIEISYKLNSDSLDIFVSDSGPGVPEEIRNKIMEPFFTTKEVNQGTGLGLSISKSIMKDHQGELSLLEETCTTFKIHLPLTF